MTPENDPLEDPGEGLPVSPTRRRFAVGFGLLMLAVILGVLAWFIATNTETQQNRGSLFGLWSDPHVRVTV